MSAPAITRLSGDVSVAAQLAPDEIAAIATAGFKSLVNHRPDGEGGPLQPLAADIEAAARAAGLQYVFQPVDSALMTLDDAAAFKTIVESLPKPVLAFCRTGTRSTRLFMAAGLPRS